MTDERTPALTPEVLASLLQEGPIWGRSFLMSNGVRASINAIGGDMSVTFGSSIGQPGITVPVEDLRILLDHYYRPQGTHP